MRLGVSMALPVAVPAAIFIEDRIWELASAGNLMPLETGSISDDRNDIWDLDGTDYTPGAVGALRAEGYWALDGDSAIQPLDV